MILVVIVASGFLFVWLTAAPKVEVGGMAKEAAASATPGGVLARVRVTFSHPTGFIELRNGEGLVMPLEGSAVYFSGETELEPGALLFLKAACAPVPEGRLFAKLVVEAEGKKTFTHVFDAEGEIDDFVELPF